VHEIILKPMEKNPPFESPLAIVDVETTGASSLYHRVIEVAVLRVEGWRIVRQFQSLVNPERFLSPTIEAVTGITNADLALAPRFADILEDLWPLLQDSVFVAHNARFDSAFLKQEFARAGRRFNPKCLCTVKLSRRLFPEYRHHDLTSIIERHGLTCEARHRALGDARVLFDFLALVRAQEGKASLEKTVHGLLRTRSLPPRMDPEVMQSLPESPGVYLLYGASGELLYVGKSKNIRERVLGHFSSDHELDMCQQVARVDARPTAGELGALLLELHLIKELHPIYNQASRSKKPLFVARRELTPEGYARLTLAEGDMIEPADASRVVAVFKNRSQAVRYLTEAAKSHGLCHKLLGLENPRSYCFGYQLKRCSGACVGEEPPDLYNLRFDRAFLRRRVAAWPFQGSIVIQERGGDGDSGEIFLIDQWCLLSSFSYSDFGQGPFIRGSHTFDYDSYKVLSRFLLDRRNRKTLRRPTREELHILLSEDPAFTAP
jgi:DNA polymerase-3 subunit epsilon